MFCPECGYKNKDENKFCLSCGKALAPQKSTEKQPAPDYDPVFEEEKRKDQILESVAQAMSLDTLKSYGDALKLLNSITDWKDANELKKQCEEKIEELHREKLILRKKRIKLAVFISAPIAVLLIIAVIVGILITPKLKYDEATEYLDNSDYSKASEIFEEIKEYKDSATALNYISALDGSITDYDKKVEILESLGDYRDSAKILLDLKYEKAAEFAADKNYLEAVNLIDSLGDYGDPDNIKQNIYKTAVEYFDNRKFSEATEIFLILGKYEDSNEYIEKIYNQAGTYFEDKKYNYAAAVYMCLGGYKDSKDKVEELYKKCLDYIAKEKYTDAIPILKNLKDYEDSESKSEEIYNMALNFIEDKKYDNAIKIFEKFGKYKEAESKLSEIIELQNKEKYNKAVKLGKDGKYDDAIKLFEELGDYSDSKSQISEMKKKRDADTYEMKGTTAWVVIDNGYLNVRKTANSDAASVGKLYNGDEVTIQATSSNGKWYKVTSGSIMGYCSVNYISTSKPIANISGSWIETEINMPHFMEITDLGNNYFYVEIHCDGDNFTWTFSGEYDYKTGLLNYIDGICTTKYDGTTTQNTNLSGTLSYSNGYIYWSFPANGNRIFEFERR